jgi:Nucleotidyltransferase domain
MTPADVERLNAVIIDWARQMPDITGLAMIGSWARGSARPDSDLDLVLLTDLQSELRRDRDWQDAIAWDRAGFAVEGGRMPPTAQYGRAISCSCRERRSS